MVIWINPSVKSTTPFTPYTIYGTSVNNGINKIILRTKGEANVDLKKILYTYQKAGIKIYYTDGYIEPVEASVLKIKTLKRAPHKDE